LIAVSGITLNLIRSVKIHLGKGEFIVQRM
jgi:hypothetical protein